MTATPIGGASIGVGTDRGMIELRFSLPGWDAPLSILLPPEMAAHLAGLLQEAVAELD
jgi:hypothetical protein